MPFDITLSAAKAPAAAQDKEVNEMSQHKLFTTGYAGKTPDSFLGTLRQHEIAVVVDIRQNPVSRKRGFSRTALSECLRQNGFTYRHMRELGVPRELRDRLRAGDFGLEKYLREFREYLAGQDEILAHLYSSAAKERCCLLCVEERSEECHRSVVAAEIAARNGRTVQIVDL